MTLTVRSASVTGAVNAGRALTHAEMDANWAHVIQSANQNFLPSGIGAVARDVQTKLREIEVNANDFTGADLGAKINQADTALGSSPGRIVVADGNATITTQIVLQ